MIERTPLLFEGIVAAAQAQALLKRRGGGSRTDWEKAHRDARVRLGGNPDPRGKPKRPGKFPALTWHDKSSPEKRTKIADLYSSVPGAKDLIDPLERTDRKETRAKDAEQRRRDARLKEVTAKAKKRAQDFKAKWKTKPSKGKAFLAWQREKNK